MLTTKSTGNNDAVLCLLPKLLYSDSVRLPHVFSETSLNQLKICSELENFRHSKNCHFKSSYYYVSEYAVENGVRKKLNFFSAQTSWKIFANVKILDIQKFDMYFHVELLLPFRRRWLKWYRQKMTLFLGPKHLENFRECWNFKKSKNQH